jgi:hypothetical protein
MEAVRVALKFSAIIAVAFFVTYGSVAYFYVRSDELAHHATTGTPWTALFSAFSVAGYIALLFFAAMSLLALLLSWLVRYYDERASR